MNPQQLDAVLSIIGRSAPWQHRDIQLFAGGREITTAERKAMIEESLAGKHHELQFTAITYRQRAGETNRNFIRFREGSLRALARSGVNTPFLRDHAQRSQAERGGTIIASRYRGAEHGEDEGVVAFEQTFLLTTPWAVQGALQGTIDRFSIGAHPTGQVLCTLCGTEVFDKCYHWPGDSVGDNTVEWEFQDAELVETSSVNVPAVMGTGIKDQLRAVLAAHGLEPATERSVQVVLGDDWADESPRVRRERITAATAAANQPKETSMKRLVAKLGLSADAAEDSAIAAVEKLETDVTTAVKRADGAELELKAEREAHERTKAQLAEHEKAAAAARTAALESAIAQLYTDGRLVRVGGKEPDSFEATLRQVHDSLGFDRFAETAARLPGKVPMTKQSVQPEGNPAGTASSTGGEVQIKTGSQAWLTAELSPRQLQLIAQMGVTEENWRKAMARGGN